ncbi:MAG: M20/M25/M40 family metallo-hydrolase, partial [Gemmatimonadota bacterium]
MSDFDLPELPSDEELGITDEDREKYGDDLQDDGPEMSADEMAALLGEEAKPKKTAEPKKKQKKQKRQRRARAAKPTEGGPGGGTTEDGPGEETPEGRIPPTPEPTGPGIRWRGPLTLAAMVVVAVVASSRTGQSRPGRASAPDTAFSSARAMTALLDIAQRPHPIGSPEHARVRQLLVDRLQALGLEPEIQTAPAMGQVTGMARATTVRNIVARLPGTSSSGAVLIAAHYDSRERAPGAADDGAGVVTILEAIRALRAAGPLRNDVIVLITDGEEVCLCGAQAFVDRHPWIDDVSVVLNFEMRGGGGPSIMFETNDQNGWIVRALEHADPPPFANSMAYEVYRRMPNNTDFTEFRRVGKQGLNFAALDRAWVYHQATDRPENLSEATLQHHGTNALSMLQYLGDADLSEVQAPNAVYFTVPVLGLVVYRAFWVLVLSGVLVGLAVLAWLLARRAGARTSGVLIGFGVSVLEVALSFGAALWLRGWTTGYAEAGSLSGSLLYSEGWWILAAVAAAFFVVTALHAIARRWLTATELSLGALVLPLVLAVTASVIVPLGAMNLQWPLAAALVSVIVVGLLRQRSGGTVGWLTTVALTVPVLLLLVPVLELVWLAMSVRLIAVLGVLAALVLQMCLPAIDWLRHPNAWWAPATGVVLVAAFFGMARVADRPSAEHPSPSTLVYAYEHGGGSALWATDPNADSTLDAEAIDWAEQHAGASFSRTRDMSDFGYPPGPTPVADARLVNAPPPEVEILSDSIDGTVRSVSMAVRSNIGAEMLRFQMDPAGRTRLLSINGMAIDQPDSLQWVEHYGVPEDPGVLLQLRMPAAEPIGLYVIEHDLRPTELLGPGPFERPADLMPDVNAMSDRAVFRYSVAAYADPRHAFMPGGARGGGAEPSGAPQPAGAAAAEPLGGDAPAAADSVTVQPSS